MGVESDKARARTASVLHDILTLADPALTANVRVIDAEFPSRRIPEPDSGALALTTNLVATRSVPEQLAVLEAMGRYSFVVSDVQRFFEYRADIAQEPEALALFARAGLKNPELFLDLGAGGRYYLFKGSPQRRGFLSPLRRYWRGPR